MNVQRAHRNPLMEVAVTVMLLSMAQVPLAAAHQANRECASAQKSAVVEAHAALEKNPAGLDIRLRLADAYIDDGCFDQALHVLEEGEALHPRSGDLQSRLRTTRSMLSEQQYFDGLQQAEQTAKLSRFLLRCSKLGDLSACDEAIALQPGDVDLLSAKGDALLKAERPADALSVYQRAAALAPANGLIAEKVGLAQAAREAAVATCNTQNDEQAARACDAALLRGSADEFAIHKRKAMLLQAANQPSQALDAYIAANLLRNDDKSVALGIVTLSESTGRKDALTLAARGSALLTLGRAIDALTPLKQALALAPGLSELPSQVARAERLAGAEARRRIAAAQPQAASQPDATPASETGSSAPPRRYSNAAPPTRSN